MKDLGAALGPQDDGVYEFGPFRLDIRERSLQREGLAVQLEPTQFQVLTVLVRQAGHLAPREQLMNAVWGQTIVEEANLTVAISKLRDKLGDKPSQSSYIETVPKSGYRFVAPVTRGLRRAHDQSAERLTSQPLPVTTSGQSTGRGRLTVAAMAALIALMAGLYWPRSTVVLDQPLTPVPLHPFGGTQEDPSFSPDGNQIAFTWRPAQSDNYDVYVLRVGELQATRLTNDPAWDMSPAWSPNGGQIAFIRRRGSKGEILLMSPAGGPEQKVIDTEGTSVTWSADSHTLLFIDRAKGENVNSIFLVSAAGGAKRRVTFPVAENSYGDSSPAISPDGRMLAFVRRTTFDVADVFVQQLDGVNPRRLTFDERDLRGLSWMPDGRELIFSSNRNGRHQLWRVDVTGPAKPRLVEGVTDARFPVVSRDPSGSGLRLVYQALSEDFNIQLLARGAHGAWNAPTPSVVAASIRDEHGPSVSPDGRRLSFVSDRSGWYEVWVCAFPETSECRQLTSFRQGYVGSPSWSPDGQRIAFDARVDGNADIYLVRADGGQPVRLTHGTSVESRPSWSGDGRWIYFRSDRTGTHQIWKMPVSGGDAIQVTRHGGYEAFESPDGKSLYYVQGRYARGLRNVSVDGGPEVRVPGFESLTASSWALTDAGILWIDATTTNPPAVIRFYDSATHQLSEIGEVSRFVIPAAISAHAVRDGSAFMWSQLDGSTHDLMLLERTTDKSGSAVSRAVNHP